MASTFTFGFSGDDIDIEDENAGDDVEMQTDGGSGEDGQGKGRVGDQIELVPAQRHALAELLSTLPSSISYNTLSIPVHTLPSKSTNITSDTTSSSITIHRRSLFDVLTQLKAEADIHIQPTTRNGDHNRVGNSQTNAPDPGPGTNNGDYEDLISGLERGDDLRSGVYEGGFKTWECGVDLASYLGSSFSVGGVEEIGWLHQLLRTSEAPAGDDDDDDQVGPVDIDIIELGAGSGVPSLVLLKHLLSQRLQNTHAQESKRRRKRIGHTRFILCDFNLQVLQLVTTANILFQIAAATTSPWLESMTSQDEGFHSEGDLHDITPNLHQHILSTLDEADIEITFLSGAWGPRFVEMLSPLSGSESSRRASLILASETLYSPPSLVPFTETLLALLRRAGRSEDDSMALVASKKMYFGVGGGVDEFISEVERRGGNVKVVKEIRDSGGGGGLGRVVLRVTG